MTSPTDSDIKMRLTLHPDPLTKIKDDGHELHVGMWSLSKTRPGFRSGYGYALHADAHFTKLPFDVDGKRGIALLFWSYGDPDYYFTGWVEPHREDEADAWVAYLNAEIARRHKGEAAQPVPNVRDGKAAQDAEDLAEQRKFEQSLGVKPFRPSPKPDEPNTDN